MKKPLRITLYILGFALLLATVAGCSFLRLSPEFGASAKGKRLEKLEQSPNYYRGEFQNTVETNMDIGFKGFAALIATRLFGDTDNQTPDWELPVQKISTSKSDQVQDTATVITWLGHSAFMIEIDGKRLLLDPMLGERASPLSFLGPKRFAALPITAADMPRIDAILISHDHYDHLDYGSVQELASKTTHFYVALGVGAHLERWGVPAKKITEMDWWEEATFEGLTFAATPSRHFSGRGLTDRMKTLWTSWVIRGRQDKIFFSGDSGYFDGFATIGEKYGPFDITLMECGQYNELWSAIHMMPEQTVQAHIDLKGKVLMPIHWGAFSLAMHGWTEPVERATAKAQELGVTVATPLIGEPLILHGEVPQQTWWRK
ncbi:MBL fold metallo-hydrolase [uncultured Pontibacter sp.]|uniref:MBL fold metallo-hydrolase n=1 Tax=uncultured Pontibacter sp. TaxID=453356 RepID=UPI00260F8112|nr:MBL fold metallo-hydrolase [uncultured Pontibacter sp.]